MLRACRAARQGAVEPFDLPDKLGSEGRGASVLDHHFAPGVAPNVRAAAAAVVGCHGLDAHAAGGEPFSRKDRDLPGGRSFAVVSLGIARVGAAADDDVANQGVLALASLSARSSGRSFRNWFDPRAHAGRPGAPRAARRRVCRGPDRAHGAGHHWENITTTPVNTDYRGRIGRLCPCAWTYQTHPAAIV